MKVKWEWDARLWRDRDGRPLVVEWFDEARAAGLSPTRAARWARYRRVKTLLGQEPISVAAAAAQQVTS